MRTKLNMMTSSKIFVVAVAIVICGFLGLPLPAAPETKPDSSTAASEKQKTFNTPADLATNFPGQSHRYEQDRHDHKSIQFPKPA